MIVHTIMDDNTATNCCYGLLKFNFIHTLLTTKHIPAQMLCEFKYLLTSTSFIT